MAYIKYHSNKMYNNHSRRECFLESNIALDYQVLIPKNGDHINILQKGKLMAEVNWSQIILFNEYIYKKNNWEWVLSEKPMKLLSLNRDKCKVNDIEVATISSGGELVPWIFKLIKKRAWEPFDPYICIEFDEMKLKPLLAVCILAMRIAEFYHSP